ncbi:hypothetical protein [Flavobacterium sp. DSR2-3-3]
MLNTKGHTFQFTNPNHIVPVLDTIIITAMALSKLFLQKKKSKKLPLILN